MASTPLTSECSPADTLLGRAGTLPDSPTRPFIPRQKLKRPSSPLARAGRRPCRHAGWIRGRASGADHIGGGPKQRTGGLRAIFLRQRRQLAFLLNRPIRPLPSRRQLCRSHPARREAGGASRSATDKIRDGREPQDRQGARSCGTPVDYAARRRGHRISAGYGSLWHYPESTQLAG
jgi:hypothetical protein